MHRKIFLAKQPFFYNHYTYTCGFPRFNMLKKELVDQVSVDLSLPKRDVTAALEIMLTTMKMALVEKRRIELRGFGSFSIRSRKERSTKNPKTGAIMNIPERKTVHFTMSRSLKEPLIKG